MTKVQTTKIGGGADYAKVADRLKQFWAENPRGSIKTMHQIQGDNIIFTTEIVADQSNEYSRRTTGTAMEKLNGKLKTFEKTESISVGRALALIGYLANGEIASSEEMEEFLSHKEQQRLQMIADLKSQVDDIEDKETLREFYKLHKGYGKEFDEYIINKSKQLA